MHAPMLQSCFVTLSAINKVNPFRQGTKPCTGSKIFRSKFTSYTLVLNSSQKRGTLAGDNKLLFGSRVTDDCGSWMTVPPDSSSTLTFFPAWSGLQVTRQREVYGISVNEKSALSSSAESLS